MSWKWSTASDKEKQQWKMHQDTMRSTAYLEKMLARENLKREQQHHDNIKKNRLKVFEELRAIGTIAMDSMEITEEVTEPELIPLIATTEQSNEKPKPKQDLPEWLHNAKLNWLLSMNEIDRLILPDDNVPLIETIPPDYYINNNNIPIDLKTSLKKRKFVNSLVNDHLIIYM